MNHTNFFGKCVVALLPRKSLPYAYQWEEDESFPIELYRKLRMRAYLPFLSMEAHGGGGGDVFYDIVVGEEFIRSGPQAWL